MRRGRRGRRRRAVVSVAVTVAVGGAAGSRPSCSEPGIDGADLRQPRCASARRACRLASAGQRRRPSWRTGPAFSAAEAVELGGLGAETSRTVGVARSVMSSIASTELSRCQRGPRRWPASRRSGSAPAESLAGLGGRPGQWSRRVVRRSSSGRQGRAFVTRSSVRPPIGDAAIVARTGAHRVTGAGLGVDVDRPRRLRRRRRAARPGRRRAARR